MWSIRVFLSLALTLGWAALLSSQRLVTVTEKFFVEEKLGISNGQLEFLVPESYFGRQQLVDLAFTPQPGEFRKKNNTLFAYWDLGQLQVGDSLGVSSTLWIYDYDTRMALFDPAFRGESRLSEYPKGFDWLEVYLAPEPNFQIKNKKLREAARSLKGETDWITTRNIFNYVIDHLTYYNYRNEYRGAKKAFQQGQGDCTEYAELMVTLCRINGLPSRIVSGKTLHNDFSVGLHDWVEVFLGSDGWVPFDPTHADGDNSSTTFENLDHKYIYHGFEREHYLLSWRYKGVGRRPLFRIRSQRSYTLPIAGSLQRARRFLYGGSPTPALHILDSLVMLYPENSLLLTDKGLAHIRIGDFDLATSVLQFALKNAINNFDRGMVLFHFAEMYARQQRTELVVSYLRKCQSLGFRTTKKDISREAVYQQLLADPVFDAFYQDLPD